MLEQAREIKNGKSDKQTLRDLFHQEDVNSLEFNGVNASTIRTTLEEAGMIKKGKSNKQSLRDLFHQEDNGSIEFNGVNASSTRMTLKEAGTIKKGISDKQSLSDLFHQKDVGSVELNQVNDSTTKSTLEEARKMKKGKSDEKSSGNLLSECAMFNNYHKPSNKDDSDSDSDFGQRTMSYSVSDLATSSSASTAIPTNSKSELDDNVQMFKSAMFPSSSSSDNGGKANRALFYLNIYDLTPVAIVNNYLYWFGLGIYHSGIEAHGMEYGFGAHEDPSSGVYEVEPRSYPGFIFRRSVLLGSIDMSPVEFRSFIEHLFRKYHGDTYHLIAKNCNHFTNEVCMQLTGKSIPGWVNRLARVGSFCNCLLPDSIQINATRHLPDHATYSDDDKDWSTSLASLGSAESDEQPV